MSTVEKTFEDLDRSAKALSKRARRERWAEYKYVYWDDILTGVFVSIFILGCTVGLVLSPLPIWAVILIAIPASTVVGGFATGVRLDQEYDKKRTDRRNRYRNADI